MARLSFKKRFKNSIKWLIFLVLLIYIAFLLKIKFSVDQFFEQLPNHIKIDYQWLWVDWQSQIHLHGLVINTNDKSLLKSNSEENSFATVDKLTVGLPSFHQVMSVSNLVTYQQLPENIALKFDKLSLTEQVNWQIIFSDLNLTIDKNLLPQECQKIELNTFLTSAFHSQLDLSFNENDETLKFKGNFSSITALDFQLQGQLDNFSTISTSNSYLSQLSINFSNLIVLQQLLNQCQRLSGFSKRTVFTEKIIANLVRFAEQKNYSLSKNLLNSSSDFLYHPKSLRIDYSPSKNTYWKKIRHLPLHNIIENIDLKLFLNKKKINQFFNTINYQLFLNKNPLIEDAIKKPTRNYLPVNYQCLKEFKGIAVLLNLKNNTVSKGRIKKVSLNRLVISEYHFGGYSELPYYFSDIESIEIKAN